MAKPAPRRNARLLTDEEFAERRPVLLLGIEQFNDGYFFEAHETWEDLWLLSPWPVRQFLQGLIQIAAAFVHLMRHEYPGTVRLLGEGTTKIAEFAPDELGLDAARLLTEARSARDGLRALGPDRFEEWDQRRIPRIHLL
jgi:predicted metal-dependent hydrolase